MRERLNTAPVGRPLSAFRGRLAATTVPEDLLHSLPLLQKTARDLIQNRCRKKTYTIRIVQCGGDLTVAVSQGVAAAADQ